MGELTKGKLIEDLRARIETLETALREIQVEPTAVMADAGAHCLSEWLNDSAPLGEHRYREPAMAAWRTMHRVARGEDPHYGWKEPARQALAEGEGHG